MPRQLVQYNLDSGGSVLVWTDASPLDAGQPVTRGLRDVGGAIVERAEQSFESAISQIEPAAQSLITRLRDSTHAPDEIVVEFGVSLHAQVGAIIAETSGEANFRVSLTWRHGPSPT